MFEELSSDVIVIELPVGEVVFVSSRELMMKEEGEGG